MHIQSHEFIPAPTHAWWSTPDSMLPQIGSNMAEFAVNIASQTPWSLCSQYPNVAASIVQGVDTFDVPIEDQGLIVRYYTDPRQAQRESAVRNPLDAFLRGWTGSTLAVPRSLGVVLPLGKKSAAGVVLVEMVPGERYDNRFPNRSALKEQVQSVQDRLDNTLGRREQRDLLGKLASDGTDLYTNGKTTYLLGRPPKHTSNWRIARTLNSLAKACIV